MTATHPVLIIGTPMFLSVPRFDVGTIIIERESAESYIQTNPPFIDMRTFAEHLSTARGARLLFGDTLLRVETLWRYYNLEFTEYVPLKYRALTSAHTKLVDMRDKEGKDADQPFRIFSDDLIELIESSSQQDERLFLYTSRRGLAPITVCGDCGTPVVCPKCTKPVVLHETAGEKTTNIFRCHTCAEQFSAHTTCAECGSWRLTDLGVAIERAYRELAHIISQERIFRIDKDTTNTQKRARTMMQDFLSTPGGVLIGTDMALLYLFEDIENIAVISLDSLFSIPDFRMNERIMNTLTAMRISAQKRCMVQTRNADQPVITYGLHGNLIDFYREEIEARRALSYPPFSVLIKITRRGKRDLVEKDMRALERELASEEVITYPSTPHKGNYVMHALIRVPKDQWVDPDMLTFLRALPPQFIVSVNPREIL
jgi:primosomal protein N' (replication factor Y)